MASKVYLTAIKIEAQLGSAFKGVLVRAGSQLERLSKQAGQLKDAKKGAAGLEALYKASQPLTRDQRLAAAFARETAEAQRLSKALEKATGDTSKLSAQLAQSQTRIEAFAGRARLKGAFEAVTSAGVKVGERLRSVAGDVVKLVGGTTAAGVALGALALKTIHAGDEIGDTADKLGIASTALQELRYGARQSGAEAEDLDRALAKLAVNLGKVSAARKGKGGGGLVGNVGEIQILGTGGAGGAGKSALADPFKHIGLSVKDLVALRPEQQVGKIADGLAKLKTHADKAATAQAIFGKGASSILPFLAEGSAGIDRMSKAGHRFGGIMSEEAVKAADQADKALKNAELAMAGVSNTLGAALLPTAVKVLEGFSDLVADNREEIKAWAERAAKWIETKAIPGLKHLGGEAKTLGERVINLVERGAKLVGGFKNLAAVVVAIRLAPLAKSVLDLGSATAKATLGIAKYVAAKWEAVAATRALNAAEGQGVPGAPASAGKAIGLAANAAMVAGAALVGYQIGSYIDERLKISETAGGKLGETGLEENTKANRVLQVVGGVSQLGPLADFLVAQRARDLQAANADIARHAGQLRTSRVSASAPGGAAVGQVHVHLHGVGDLSPEKAKKHAADVAKHLGPHIDRHLERKADQARRLSLG